MVSQIMPSHHLILEGSPVPLSRGPWIVGFSWNLCDHHSPLHPDIQQLLLMPTADLQPSNPQMSDFGPSRVPQSGAATGSIKIDLKKAKPRRNQKLFCRNYSAVKNHSIYWELLYYFHSWLSSLTTAILGTKAVGATKPSPAWPVAAALDADKTCWGDKTCGILWKPKDC